MLNLKRETRLDWTGRKTAMDPDANHPSNDFVKPATMSNWLSEEEALDLIEKSCAIPGCVSADGSFFWKWEKPKTDGKGFLRIRARHDTVKAPGHKYHITTQPLRCRVYTEQVVDACDGESVERDVLIVNKESVEYFQSLSSDFGLKSLYPELFEPNAESAKPEKQQKKRKRDEKKDPDSRDPDAIGL
jgi:hypothetical protein